MSPFTLIGTVIDKIFPDKTEAEKVRLRLFELEQSGELAAMAALQQWDKAQAGVNAAEAAHRSLLVAGWRPAVGWVCVAALGMNFIVFPIVEWAVAITGHEARLPDMNTAMMLELVLGMLGLGGLRTWEKIKKVTR